MTRGVHAVCQCTRPIIMTWSTLDLVTFNGFGIIGQEDLGVRKMSCTMLNVTTFSKEISPALYFSTRILYMRTGLDPVGRPRMKGCSGVGLKCLILSEKLSEKAFLSRGGGHVPMMYLAM